MGPFLLAAIDGARRQGEIVARLGEQVIIDLLFLGIVEEVQQPRQAGLGDDTGQLIFQALARPAIAGNG